MRSGNRQVFAALTVASLITPIMAGELQAQPAMPDAALAASAGEETELIGDPYMIDGVVHTPEQTARLDETGYAAVLWETAQGHRTAIGEVYAPDAISAAHRTLPLPSYVEVTALETGRTILVRVNDRGPILNDRIIALSPGAARQLGLEAIDGTAPVRVRKVNPPEQERAALRSGQSVAERIGTPPGLRAALVKRLSPPPIPISGPIRTLSPNATRAPAASSVVSAPTPSVTSPVVQEAPVPSSQPAPSPGSGRVLSVAQAPAQDFRQQHVDPPPSVRHGAFVVQIAALSSKARAQALATSLGGFIEPLGTLFRVRMGPFETEAAARKSLGAVHAKGYAEARVMANDAR